MTRIMADAATPAGIPAAYAGFTAGYLTGTPGQEWAGHDATVWIDQGAAPGAPAYQATVIDVEAGAYSVADVAGWTARCTAPRPTVYCSLANYEAVRAVWAGDVWLTGAGGQPVPDDPLIVAVQDVFATGYDLSTVSDEWWPELPPESEKEMISGILGSKTMASGTVCVPFPAGSFKGVTVAHDFTAPGTSLPVRVAFYSESKGYSQIDTIEVTGNGPVTRDFAEPDVAAVSFENQSAAVVGYVIA